MQLEVHDGVPVTLRLKTAIPQCWRAPLAGLAMAWLAIGACLHRDLAAMVGQWWDSSTYNHVLLVPFILGWLVTLRWPQLKLLTPRPWRGGLALFALATFAWVLGAMAELAQLRELALVLMLQAAVVAVLGLRIAFGLLFPLAYMLFLVPAGDEAIPLLQTITTKITTVLLAATDIPARITGVFITTPAGYFRVAEACSGVKFLVAMIAFGVIAAHVCFRSPRRRTVFILACLVAPVLANGVRAWGTIAIAQVAGIGFASGFDHVFYGWVFFALVMAAVMAGAWRWFDRPADDPMIDAKALMASPRLDGRPASLRATLGAIATILLIALGWTAVAEARSAVLPARLQLPEVAGWHRVETSPLYPWVPLFAGADHRLQGRYADAQGHVVDVAFALYASQGEGRKADGFGQGAVPLGSRWAWSSAGPTIAGSSSVRIEAPGPTVRLALTWYGHDNALTASRPRLKLMLLGDRLALRARSTSALIISAEEGPRAADEALAAFLGALGPVDRWSSRLAGH